MSIHERNRVSARPLESFLQSQLGADVDHIDCVVRNHEWWIDWVSSVEIGDGEHNEGPPGFWANCPLILKEQVGKIGKRGPETGPFAGLWSVHRSCGRLLIWHNREISEGVIQGSDTPDFILKTEVPKYHVNCFPNPNHPECHYSVVRHFFMGTPVPMPPWGETKRWDENRLTHFPFLLKCTPGGWQCVETMWYLPTIADIPPFCHRDIRDDTIYTMVAWLMYESWKQRIGTPPSHEWVWHIPPEEGRVRLVRSYLLKF